MKMIAIRKIGVLLVFTSLLTSSCFAQSKNKILTGAEQMDQLLPLLQGKRVALLVNNTSVIGKTHLVDSLLGQKINVKKIFSPEHGFRGNAPDGAEINDSIDASTNLPVVSLYGKSRKATPEQLTDVDVVIFDIQDVGARFYTYISSMHNMMEACAENGKKMIVLDRPNPNGSYVDGPVLLDASLKSFVGMHPIPIVYGLTIGELATMINGEGWLAGGKKCDLQVVTLKNYDHKKKYSVLIKPSPNLPNDHAIAMYPSICLFEGTVMSLGRGTKTPFEILGHPSFKDYAFKFKPESIPGMSTKPPLENKMCYGVDLRNEKVNGELSLKYLIKFYHEFPDNEKEKFFTSYFDKLAGTKTLKEQIKQGLTEEKIKDTWQKDLKAYKEKRKKYLLYP